MFKNQLRAAWAATISALVVAAPAQAFAAVSVADGLGGLVYAGITDILSPFLALLVAGAYLTAFWLAFSGLMAFVRASDGGGHSHHRYLEALMKLAGCGLLASLPDACGVGLSTFFGTDAHFTGSLAASFANHTTADCTAGGMGTDGITCVAKNVGNNFVAVFVPATFYLMLVTGVAGIFSAIHKLAQSHSEHSRGIPDGLGRKLVISAVLCNAGALIEAIEHTFGFTAYTINAGGAQQLGGGGIPSMLAYTYGGGAGGPLLAKYEELIGWLFVILMAFGVVAVWRGLGLLRDHQEGRGDTTAQAMVHLTGGVLLCNGKVSTCLVLTTMLGNGLGFC